LAYISVGPLYKAPVFHQSGTMADKVDASHDEVVHLELSEEEKIIERKLRRRIDFVIMPLVILVYLMNYIDRYA
jgi:hypothetical protein